MLHSATPALGCYGVLAQVFSFVDKSDLPSTARVCKGWQEPALDELWGNLDSLFPLLELLGPLVYEKSGWVRDNIS